MTSVISRCLFFENANNSLAEDVFKISSYRDAILNVRTHGVNTQGRGRIELIRGNWFNLLLHFLCVEYL